MKQYLVLVLTLFLLPNLPAQQSEQKIRYFFGYKIDTILHETFNDLASQLEESEALAIACGALDTMMYVDIISYCKTCEIYDDEGDIDYWRGFLAKNTNRYYLLNNQKVPILLSELDSDYGVIKMLEGGGVRQVIQLIGEFEPRIYIVADPKGQKIYKVKYVNIAP